MRKTALKKKVLGFLFLVIANLIVWDGILKNPVQGAEVYFFDVGQGDSEMINLPGDVQILIDGGSSNKVLDNLSKILPTQDRYIDLIILSHPELDHFGGLVEVARRYQVGAFIYNGRDKKTQSFEEFKKVLKDNNIQTIILGEGDKIKYQNNLMEVLSPSEKFKNGKDINNSTLVLNFIGSGGLKILFAGDIGKEVEKYLAGKYELQTDVLKIPHHGSKFSSTENFIKRISPKISIIEVGKNSYGHPTQLVLNRLKSINSKIFRTDKNGIIKITSNISGVEQNLNIFTER